MASPNRLTELSTLIHEKTSIVDAYIKEKRLPAPSFDATYPPLLELPEDVAAARQAALEAMDELEAHLRGPTNSVYYKLIQTQEAVGLHAMAKFRLAETFPLESTATVEEIAQKSGLDNTDCERILRQLISHRLFSSPEPGVIAHSAGSAAVATVPHLRNFVEMVLSYIWTAIPHLASILEKYPGSEENTETAFNLGQGIDEPFFNWIAKSPEKAKIFGDAMTFLTVSPGMDKHWAIDGFDWSPFAEGTVVDVGGSYGIVAVELAKLYPSMNIIVQDRPEVISSAPTNISSKISFQVHDFFTAQPVKNADVYFFRQIFHDWSDKYCRLILQNLIPALKQGAKIIIMDDVVPAPGEISEYQLRVILNWDMVMKSLFNSRERSAPVWKAMIESVDKRFVMREARNVVGSQMGFVEIEWTG